MDPYVPWRLLGRPTKEHFLRNVGRYRGRYKEPAEALYQWVSKGGFWPEGE